MIIFNVLLELHIQPEANILIDAYYHSQPKYQLTLLDYKSEINS